MKNGLYAVAGLDGAPLAALEAEAVFPGFGTSASGGPDFRAEAQDGWREAIDRHAGRGWTSLFLGHLVEIDARRRELGLPPVAGQAEIAAAAHERWGVRATTRLGGEWAMIRWNELTRTVVLIASECARDAFYYALAKGRLAVAPSLARLTRLSWVDDTLDAQEIVASLSRYEVRRALLERTLVRGVSRVVPGSCVTIQGGESSVEFAPPSEPGPPRQIAFDEAVHEAEALLLGIVRDRLAGRRDIAVLLSGGLDSSLMAALAAESLAPDQRLHLLCSAVPEGSGVEDETGWASLVADHLGVPLTLVTPHPTANAYLPTPRTFADRESATPSPRHYLYEALEDATAGHGADLLIDGGYGELSISGYGDAFERPASWPRAVARSLRDRMSSWRQGSQVDAGQHHARLSQSALREAQGLQMVSADAAVRQKPRGSGPAALGWEKAWAHQTATSRPDVRVALPFRDPRVLRLVGAFPADLAAHDPTPRPLIRAILRGRVPGSIADRRCKMAFSPSYHQLVKAHAPEARRAISAQRAAGVGEWLDLDWLDGALARAGDGHRLTSDQAFVSQGTAMAAEFLRWWNSRAAED